MVEAGRIRLPMQAPARPIHRPKEEEAPTAELPPATVAPRPRTGVVHRPPTPRSTVVVAAPPCRTTQQAEGLLLRPTVPHPTVVASPNPRVPTVVLPRPTAAAALLPTGACRQPSRPPHRKALPGYCMGPPSSSRPLRATGGGGR